MNESIKSKSVVIVSYDMIPHATSWGGSQRMYFLSEYLVQNNYDVTVFSCKKHTNNHYGHNINFRNKSIEVSNIFYRNFLYSKKSSQSSENGNSSYNRTRKIREFVKNIKFVFKMVVKIDKYIFNEPSFLTGLIVRNWSKHTANEIKSFINKNNIKNVIITAPPFAMLSMGKILKKFDSNLNIIMDYRDPWNLWKKQSEFAWHLEKKALKYCDKITCTNENLAYDMATAFKIDRNKFCVVSNGFSEELWKNIEVANRCDNNQMVITYAGSIDFSKSSELGYRNTKIILQSLEKCMKSGKRIKIRFVGVVDPYSQECINLKKKFDENIEIIGVVSNEESVKYMLDSDVLLLIHTATDSSSNYLVSGKLYDYIKAQKPILSVGSPNGLHAQIISREGLGIHVENENESVDQAFNEFYNMWVENELNLPSSIDVEKYSRNIQYSKIENLFKE
jgi:glycosyltransferase involved in cell wall biosynthesis